MKLKTYTFCTRAINYAAITILTVLTFLSATCTVYVNDYDQVFYIGDRAWSHTVVIAIALILVCLTYKKTSIRITDSVLIGTITIMTLLTAAYIAWGNLPPRFDQRQIREVAGNLMIEITEDFEPGGYAAMYPYQNGIILLYEWILNLVGYENYIAIQYFNLTCMTITWPAFYFIFKKFSKYYREIVTGLALFIPYWLYADFLYGIVPGLCLGVWGIYFSLCFMEDMKWHRVLLVGATMSLSCIMKLNYLILAIAIIVATALAMLKMGHIRYMFLVVSIVVFYLLGNKIVSAATEVQTGMPVTEGIPGVASVAMGLHEHTGRGAGWHDNYPENTYETSGYDPAETSKLAKEDLRQSAENFMSHPAYMVGFFIRKTASMWSEPTYYSWAAQEHRDEDLDSKIFFPLIPYVTGFMNQLQTALYLFALLYFVHHRREDGIFKLLPTVYLLGGFICHTFWEAHSQYALPYVMLIIPYSVVGIVETVKYLCITDKDRRIRIIAVMAAITLILSLPQISSGLTLSRDDVRYAEYMKEPY